MNHSFNINVLALAGFLSLVAVGPSQGEKEPAEEEKKWQTDIVQFEKELRRIVATAKMPEEADFIARLKRKEGDIEVITDGGGGVVDFAAAKGTVQHVATKTFRNAEIDWELTLGTDTEIAWNQSTDLVAKEAMDARPEGEDYPIFVIDIRKTNAGPFVAGDRIRLQSKIDDFSRFTKGFSNSRGLVAVYFLEDAPKPIFFLRLEGAKMRLVKPAAEKEE